MDVGASTGAAVRAPLRRARNQYAPGMNMWRAQGTGGAWIHVWREVDEIWNVDRRENNDASMGVNQAIGPTVLNGLEIERRQLEIDGVRTRRPMMLKDVLYSLLAVVLCPLIAAGVMTGLLAAVSLMVDGVLGGGQDMSPSNQDFVKTLMAIVVFLAMFAGLGLGGFLAWRRLEHVWTPEEGVVRRRM